MKKYDMIRELFKKGDAPKFCYLFDKKTLGDVIELNLKYDNLIVNTEDNHYKFWTYTANGRYIKYIWGKIGSEGSSIEKDDSEFEAIQKMNKKIFNGYVKISWK